MSANDFRLNIFACFEGKKNLLYVIKGRKKRKNQSKHLAANFTSNKYIFANFATVNGSAFVLCLEGREKKEESNLFQSNIRSLEFSSFNMKEKLCVIERGSCHTECTIYDERKSAA